MKKAPIGYVCSYRHNPNKNFYWQNNDNDPETSQQRMEHVHSSSDQILQNGNSFTS